MADQDFNCYNPSSNPTGDIPPVHYKVFMCDWRGKTPSVFYGTWYLVSAPDGMTEGYPLAPEAVEFRRTTKDCDQTSFYAPPARLSPLPPNPFVVAIIDPLSYEYRTFPQQAEDCVSILGEAISGPTGDTPTGIDCSATTFTMTRNFNSMPRKFSVTITGISF